MVPLSFARRGQAKTDRTPQARGLAVGVAGGLTQISLGSKLYTSIRGRCQGKSPFLSLARELAGVAGWWPTLRAGLFLPLVPEHADVERLVYIAAGIRCRAKASCRRFKMNCDHEEKANSADGDG